MPHDHLLVRASTICLLIHAATILTILTSLTDLLGLPVHCSHAHSNLFAFTSTPMQISQRF